ncbi:hypothetical protein [Azospirillum sp. TSH64]|uniref:hypothetical protein n=1 Tax=Azospirillum sp. TSH64 TaxID=652740 RepID=UPI0011B258B2|nr:hypothetical protein [Azospirillum sp. TSH64]
MDALDRFIDELLEQEVRAPLKLKAPLGKAERHSVRRLAARANIDLLRNALKELRGAIKSAQKQGNPMQIGARLDRVYHRKVAEQAQLFPVLHEFESGYRCHVAAWMEDHYKTRNWWSGVLEAAQGLAGYSAFKGINGRSVSFGIYDSINALLRGIDGPNFERGKVQKASSGIHLLQLSTLSDLERLTFEHWTDISKSLRSTLSDGSPLTEAVFKGMFKRVREARNDCYHHNEVAKRLEIVSNAEQLLALIGTHLESAVDLVNMSAVKPIQFNIESDNTLEPHFQNSEHDVVMSFQGMDVPIRGPQQARSTGDAVAKALCALNADQRAMLLSLAVVSKDKSPPREKTPI